MTKAVWKKLKRYNGCTDTRPNDVEMTSTSTINGNPIELQSGVKKVDIFLLLLMDERGCGSNRDFVQLTCPYVLVHVLVLAPSA